MRNSALPRQRIRQYQQRVQHGRRVRPGTAGNLVEFAGLYIIRSNVEPVLFDDHQPEAGEQQRSAAA